MFGASRAPNADDWDFQVRSFLGVVNTPFTAPCETVAQKDSTEKPVENVTGSARDKTWLSEMRRLHQALY